MDYASSSVPFALCFMHYPENMCSQKNDENLSKLLSNQSYITAFALLVFHKVLGVSKFLLSYIFQMCNNWSCPLNPVHLIE